jgi:hypothetical protein
MMTTTVQTARGYIVTGEHIAAHTAGGRFLGAVEVSDYATHLEAVRAAARRFFGSGSLERYQGAELPASWYARWGWTRETRAEGEVSITVDHYFVK